MTRHQQFIEAACEAVRKVEPSAMYEQIWTDDVIFRGAAESALRAIPSPPAPSEEELVSLVRGAIVSGWQSTPMNPDSILMEHELDAMARAALSVIRSHDAREAEEVKQVLRRILDLDDRRRAAFTYTESPLELPRDLRSKAERLAGKP